MKMINELIEKGAIFYISHSGGKDSQAMYAKLLNIIPYNQIIVIHSHLKEVEWPGVIEHIKLNINHPLNIVEAKKSLLGMVEQRGMFPSPKYRQCTSDLKRNPIEKFIRRDMKARECEIAVNCMGLRSEESRSRAKRKTFMINSRLTIKNRIVYDWLPIHDLTTDEVFETIKNANQKPFWTYTAGNQRLSCVFCIMGSKNDLRNGAKYNHDLFKKYSELEKKIGHTMFTIKNEPIYITEYLL